MTIPTERCSAIFAASLLLREIGYTMTSIPASVRRRAREVLRHFPWDTDVLELAKCCPHILQVPLDREV